MSIHLANKVGAEGEVFAVDVNSYRLDRLKEHLSERELFQITTVKGDYDNPNLPEGTLDIVFIIDTYHEISAHKTMLKHVYNSLKPGGKLVLLEKLKEGVKNASRKSQTDAHTLSSNYVKKEMEAANFSIIEEAYDLGDWEKDETKPMWLVIGKKEAKIKNRKL